MWRDSGFIGALSSLLMLAVLSGSPSPAVAQLLNVTVPDLGSLTGSVAETERTGRPIYQFLGIQYAEVTTRFKEPAAAGPWEGVRDATAPGPACPQFMLSESSGLRHGAADVDFALVAAAADRAEEDEQCLVLDVYSPTVNSTAQLPVLVYIHGGAFIGGSAQQVHPGYVLEYDLVLVAIQYRLGPLGFLSLETDDIPGNVGLADMLTALQWVQNHVSSFGGDPTRVTVAGASAGAASAGLLQLSTLTEGLFQQVYLASGSALAPFALEDAPQTRALVLATAAGCNVSADMAECLRSASLDELRNAFLVCAAEDMLSGGTGLGGALPVVQRAGAVRMLEQQPLELLKGDSYRAMPALVGIVKHEGLYPVSILSIYKDLLESLYGPEFFDDKTGEDLVQRVLMTDENKVVAEAVAEKYFKDGTLTSVNAMLPSLVDLTGAVYFKGPAVTFSKYNAKDGANTYLYTFNHQDQLNAQGASHGADFPYIFPQPGNTLTDKEEEVSLKIVELLANFVIYGNPTPEGAMDGVPDWQSYNKSAPFYMVVDDAFQLRQDLDVQLTIAAVQGLVRSAGAAVGAAASALLLSAITAVARLL